MRDLGRESEDLRKRGEELIATDMGEDNGIKEEVDSNKTQIRLAESQARLASLQDRLSTMMKDGASAANERSEANEALNSGGENEEASMEEDEDDDTRQCKGLFKELKFFFGREVPRESLLFLIRAFGGTASWGGDGAPFIESDEDITHQIVDRPSQGHVFLSRDYVQPQWVYDCINSRVLLLTHDYALGRVPPPHLSPFVDNDKEGYLPEYAETIKRLQAASHKKVLPLPGEEGFEDSNGFIASIMAHHTETNEEMVKERKEATIEKAYMEELEKEVAGIPIQCHCSQERKMQKRSREGSKEVEMVEGGTMIYLHLLRKS